MNGTIVAGPGNERVRRVLERLHAESGAQEAELAGYFRDRAVSGSLDWRRLDGDANRFLADKLVALEPGKAAAARANFAEAGLAGGIDLREGDLRETLADLRGPVDFALIDIWIEMARPALEIIAPHLRPGAVVVTDNTAQFREDYADYLDFVADPKQRLRTMTLPFAGGLEMSVRY